MVATGFANLDGLRVTNMIDPTPAATRSETQYGGFCISSRIASIAVSVSGVKGVPKALMSSSNCAYEVRG
jgi:hypothetical protein